MNTSDHPVSVFLVDDDPMYLSSLKYDLSNKFNNGLDIRHFTTGEDCLQHMNEEPDIVVLDYFLQNEQRPEGLNGIQVLQQIRSRWKKTIVIILSGQDKLQVALDSIKNGAYDYVAKSETAFVHLEKLLRSTIYKITLNRQVRFYEKRNFILGLLFLLVLLVNCIIFLNR